MKTNTFEKNPSRGGTPAKERITILRILEKTVEGSKSENDERALRLVLSNWVTVRNRRRDVRL